MEFLILGQQLVIIYLLDRNKDLQRQMIDIKTLDFINQESASKRPHPIQEH